MINKDIDEEPTQLGGGDPLKLKILLAIMTPFSFISLLIFRVIDKFKK